MTDRLDAVFHALSDKTRRAILMRMMQGPATVSDLALPFDITMPTLLSHLSRLEQAGLVRSAKQGRVRRSVAQIRWRSDPRGAGSPTGRRRGRTAWRDHSAAPTRLTPSAPLHGSEQ